MVSNKEISLMTDLLILESFSDNGMVKSAQNTGFISSIIETVKEFIKAHIKEGDTTGSVINMLAPGFIGMLLTSAGLPRWISLLIGLLMNVLHVDVAGIIRTFFSNVKSAATSGPVSSDKINNIANTITQQYSPMESQSFDKSMKDARILKLALINYDSGLNKNAVSLLGGVKSALAVSTFIKILKWIAIAILSAGGLLVAGDAVNKVIGRPSAFDKIKTTQPQRQVQLSTQTKFKLNPSYSDVQKNTSDNTWFERIQNNRSSIEDLILNYAKSVYDLSGVNDSSIKDTAGFKAVVKSILDWNIQSPNDSVTFIPDIFKSKKEIVDHFIDDVANK